MSQIAFKQIHHVSFLVKNLEVSLDFYCNILSLKKKDNRPDFGFDGAWLAINDSQEIHLMVLDNPDPIDNRPAHGGRDRHAAFSVEDIKPLQAALDSNDINYTLSKSGRAALFVRDPDSNTLEFIEATS